MSRLGDFGEKSSVAVYSSVRRTPRILGSMMTRERVQLMSWGLYAGLMVETKHKHHAASWQPGHTFVPSCRRCGEVKRARAHTMHAMGRKKCCNASACCCACGWHGPDWQRTEPREPRERQGAERRGLAKSARLSTSQPASRPASQRAGQPAAARPCR